MAEKRLREWQKRGLIVLNNVVGVNPDFEADVAYLREHKDDPEAGDLKI